MIRYSGVALFELLNNVITTSKEDLQQITELINVSVQKVEVKLEKAIIFAENNKQALDILSAKIDYMKEEIICLKEQNTKQQQDIWRNESYSRRNNFLFRGYDQSNQSCDVIVRDIMSRMGVEAVDRIPMVRCHYLNNNKQTIARFHSFADRERIGKNGFNLKTAICVRGFPCCNYSRKKTDLPNS